MLDGFPGPFGLDPRLGSTGHRDHCTSPERPQHNMIQNFMISIHESTGLAYRMNTKDGSFELLRKEG